MSCEAVTELAMTRSTRSSRTFCTAAVAVTSARAGDGVFLGDGKDIASIAGDVDGWTASGWTPFKATEPVAKPRHVVAIRRLWSSDNGSLVFGEGVEDGLLIVLLIGCDSESMLFRMSFAYRAHSLNMVQFDAEAVLCKDRLDRV